MNKSEYNQLIIEYLDLLGDIYEKIVIEVKSQHYEKAANLRDIENGIFNDLFVLVNQETDKNIINPSSIRDRVSQKRTFKYCFGIEYNKGEITAYTRELKINLIH